jgi:hypothetical protein
VHTFLAHDIVGLTYSEKSGWHHKTLIESKVVVLYETSNSIDSITYRDPVR